MNAPSLQFLIFGIVGALAYRAFSPPVWRQSVILVLNLAFFAALAGGLLASVPYAAFLLVGYLAMLAVWQRQDKLRFAGLLALVLVLFFWLKHYSFIPSSTYLPFAYTVIGLSYVFFRVLHLIIEARQGGFATRPSLVSFLNYTLHFPALISGPIQFYPDFAEQEDRPLPVGLADVGEAFWRITCGFFKVSIVSLVLSSLQKSAIAALSPDDPIAIRTVLSASIWAIYPLFLYANFSGYTDFVIGVARLFGFKLPENFNRPFTSENFIALWSRWHITLSTWLKTYVYMPILVSSMRRFPSRAAESYLGVFAYFVTFFLVGAWHGQTSEFLFFGVLQGGGVAANKLYQNVATDRLGRKEYRKLANNDVYRWICRSLTFTWFALTLLWFWSSWTEIFGLARTAGFVAIVSSIILVIALAAPILGVLTWIRSFPSVEAVIRSRYSRTVALTLMVMAMLISTFILSSPAPDVVYKNF